MNNRLEKRSDGILPFLVSQPTSPDFASSKVPFVGQEIVKLYQLFTREESVAAFLNDDKTPLNRKQVDRAIAVAREIAEAGYGTNLVPLDEQLDINQLYRHPNAAEAMWILSQLELRLKPEGNTAWYARVCAYLSYLSSR